MCQDNSLIFTIGKAMIYENSIIFKKFVRSEGKEKFY